MVDTGSVAVGRGYSYLAYGLGIRAAVPLPELVPGEAGKEAVSIRFGRVKRPPSEVLEKGWGHYGSGEDCLFWRGVGAFSVRGGRWILIEPSPGLDEAMLRLFVLGPVLAVLLRQRGHLLLHASAVAVSGGAVLFLGSSGRGKSTTAAALHARGHGLVTDDVAVLRVGAEGAEVFPGFPQLKLWPEALVSLGDDPEELPRWNPDLEKRSRPAAHAFSPEAVPVEQVYVLDEGEVTEITPLRPQEAFVELVRNTYGSDYALQTAIGVGSADHFRKCADLMDVVSVRGLRRPRTLSRLPELARLVERDLLTARS